MGTSYGIECDTCRAAGADVRAYSLTYPNDAFWWIHKRPDTVVAMVAPLRRHALETIAGLCLLMHGTLDIDVMPYCDSGGGIPVEWFLKHRGHTLTGVDEYGRRFLTLEEADGKGPVAP